MQYYYFSFIWEFFSSRLDHICQLVSLPSRRIPSVLSNIESAQFDTINRTIKGLMLPSAVTYVHSKGDSSQNGKTFSYPIHITRSGPDRRSVSFLIQCGTYIQTNSSLPHISFQNPSVTCMPFSFGVSYTFQNSVHNTHAGQTQ